MPYKSPTRLRKSALKAQLGRCCYCGKAMWLEIAEALSNDHGFTLPKQNYFSVAAYRTGKLPLRSTSRLPVL